MGGATAPGKARGVGPQVTQPESQGHITGTSAGSMRRQSPETDILPIAKIGGDVLLLGGQRATHVESARQWKLIVHIAVGASAGTRRLAFHEFSGADDLSQGTGNGFASTVAVHVLEGTHSLLDVTDVHNASCSVRTPLPRASADEKDTDQ